MNPPTVFITARTLHERCRHNAIGIELRDLTGTVRAYEIHGRNGPWLMTVAEWQHYRHLSATMQPTTSLS